MGEAKNWIEVVIFFVGWIAVVAALKQGQKDLKEGQDRIDKSMSGRLDRMSDKLDDHVSSLSKIGATSDVHEEQIATLKKLFDEHTVANAIAFDEYRGGSQRHGRQLAHLEKWQAVANSTLRRLDPSWTPPINGD